ncbi:MAG TPA: phosphomannomutase, partial [Acidimicrobiaceae bacterium]|nr:phosphomannomutase [Acidimicrobiaceae bacterium]HCB37037.1 phosphomannomutase [Acidimicrobiaceae bacterium]
MGMMGTMSEPVTPAAAWLAVEPDAAMRAEIERNIGRPDWVADHFDAPLRFGTAGLRGAIGPGPARMNRVTARLAARALGRVLADDGLAGRGVVVGFDARTGSADYALDSARVLAAAGVPAALIDGAVPTPVLARQLLVRGGAAAVMVTASHNPRTDNGYKVYWADGTQIRPPVDERIEARMAEQLAGADLVADGDLAPRHEVELIATAAAIADYVGAAVRGFEPATDADGAGDADVVYTALCGVGAETLGRAFAVAGLAPPIRVVHQCRPDPAFPGLPFPNPEEPGTLDDATALADERGVDLVLANDPDADRLAVAVRTAGRGAPWRRLTGDELGVLLCDHMI